MSMALTVTVLNVHILMQFNYVAFCTDMDECLLSIHQCDMICENTEGSYVCSCGEGYQLDTDEYTCIGNSSLQ